MKNDASRFSARAEKEPGPALLAFTTTEPDWSWLSSVKSVTNETAWSEVSL